VIASTWLIKIVHSDQCFESGVCRMYIVFIQANYWDSSLVGALPRWGFLLSLQRPPEWLATSFTCLTWVAVHRPIGPRGGFQTDSARIPWNFTCYEVNRLRDVIGMQYRSHPKSWEKEIWKGNFFYCHCIFATNGTS
jgi:hypothetical protein